MPPTNTGRCLITGIRGFTGRYVEAEMRSAGWDVFGIAYDRGNSLTTHHVRPVDLIDLPAVQAAIKDIRPDVVIHLAAVAFVAHGDARAMYETNIVGTRNLLQALADADLPLRSVLLASSANIYGNATQSVLDENCPANPANDYAVSKMAMESMARLWLPALPITIVRPFNYTGVGQDPRFLIPKIVEHFQRGALKIELGNLDIARDFSDVRNVATAYRMLAERPVPGEVFNVCSGKATSLAAIIAELEAIAGYTINVRVNPAFVRANEIRHLQGDGGKFISIIGELPKRELRDTLQWMYSA